MIPETIAIYALSSAGAGLARKLKANLPGSDLFLPARLAYPGSGEIGFVRLAEAIIGNFWKFRGHIVIAAAGIVVRTIAPLLAHKTHDPAVVVVDQEGRFAVSLLSGHLGGANDLARRAAGILGGQAVITTATDAAGLPAVEVEAARLGLKIENFEALSRVSLDVLEGRTIDVHDPDGWFWPVLADWPGAFKRLGQIQYPSAPYHRPSPRPSPRKRGEGDAQGELSSFENDPVIWVGDEFLDLPKAWLIVRPPSIVVGIGCNRGTMMEEIEGLLRDSFVKFGLSVLSAAKIASIEAKSDEPGILELAKKMNIPAVFHGAVELAGLETPHPSDIVEKHVGVKSVCEAAAMLTAGTGRLVIPKQKSPNATLAAARIASPSSASVRDGKAG